MLRGQIPQIRLLCAHNQPSNKLLSLRRHSYARPRLRALAQSKLTASYATVSNSTICQRPPQGAYVPHLPDLEALNDAKSNSFLIDRTVLEAAASRANERPTLHEIIDQYISQSGTILDVSLPYESRPPEGRRARRLGEGSSDSVVAVAHCAVVGGKQRITLSSGFALDIQRQKVAGDMIIITCAHTLEEIKQWPALVAAMSSQTEVPQSGSFVVTGTLDGLEVFPVSKVLSALPRSDLLLLSCPIPDGKLASLPVSPYPVHKHTEILAHFVRHQLPDSLTVSKWMPWIGDSCARWAQGEIAGYRDFAGRETEPGTYDALSHLFFTPIPTAGSSGGPIIDKETGAVVGVMLGSRTNNRVEGELGWGVPSETIFEMFTLPGLEGRK